MQFFYSHLGNGLPKIALHYTFSVFYEIKCLVMYLNKVLIGFLNMEMGFKVKRFLLFSRIYISFFYAAPRSRLAWKCFIDIDAGVIDANFRGKVGLIFFHHFDLDFQVKVGDRIANEKSLTPPFTFLRWKIWIPPLERFRCNFLIVVFKVFEIQHSNNDKEIKH